MAGPRLDAVRVEFVAASLSHGAARRVASLGTPPCPACLSLPRNFIQTATESCTSPSVVCVCMYRCTSVCLYMRECL